MRRLILDIRFLPALVLGLVVAFGLFLLMHNLISNNQQGKVNSQQLQLVNFVQVQHNEQVQTINHNRPPPPPPQKKPPPSQQIQQAKSTAPHQARQLPVNVKFDTSNLGNGSGAYVGNIFSGGNRGSSAELSPIFRIKPIYPAQARQENITGTVTTCFTVNPDGSVSNPSVEQASSPQVRRILGQAALRTIVQWKFLPKKENGKPVATNNVCQQLKFQLSSSKNGGGGGI